MAGGIPLMNLGAMPAIPSPATGIPQQNILTQLGQEAGKIPAEVQALKQDQNKTALGDSALKLQDQQLKDIQRKTVQDRYDRNIQMVKNNPALKKSPALLSAIAADAKTLEVVPPIMNPTNVPGSSATAIPASTGAASPAGGAAPAGTAPPQAGGQTAGQDPAMNGGIPAQTGGQNDGQGGPEIDLEAISPHPQFSQFVLQPNFTKEAYALTPAQRQAAFPPSMFAPGDQPPQSFYDAPKSWGPDDTAKATQARMIVQQTIKNGDPKSIVAAVDAIAPMYKDDPNYDISKLIDPSAWQSVNKLARDKLDIMRRAGVISEKSLDLRTRKVDSDIQMAQTREGLLRYTAEQKRLQNANLPTLQQLQISNLQNEIQTRTKNAQTAAGQLQQRIQQNQATNASHEKGDAIRIRGQLNTSINSLQNNVRALVQSGMDGTPAKDPKTGEDTTMGALLAQQILDAQDALKQVDETVKSANSPQARSASIQNQLPNSTSSRPGNVPKGAITGKVNGSPTVNGYQYQGKTYLMDGTPVP